MRIPFWARWRWARLVERAQIAAANALPRWLVYRAAIRLGAEATQGRYSKTEVPALPFVDAISRWEL